jgi:tRNA dimethylallyltransferase
MKPMRSIQAKPKVIAIVGPTASGKTALGISLATKIGGEIISADSRQIYKGMNLVARVPTKKEMAGVPHHLLAAIDPKKPYSAGAFAKAARKKIVEIQKRNRVPIVVGGTGFYTDALLRGLTLPEVPADKKLRAELSKKTRAQLFAMLKKIDLASAARIDAKNPVRLIRAIEIAKALGKVPELAHYSPYEVQWIGLAPDTKTHQKNIEKSIRDRLKKGMVKEAATLRAHVSKKRFLGLGFEFAALADFLDKKINKEELVVELMRGELRYAKRQMRWFKRNKDIIWFS